MSCVLERTVAAGTGCSAQVAHFVCLGLGTRTFLYDNSLRPHRDIISGSLYSKRVTREYFLMSTGDGDGDGPVEVNEARLRSLQVGTSGDPDADYKTDYTYESTTGRLGNGKPLAQRFPLIRCP